MDFPVPGSPYIHFPLTVGWSYDVWHMVITFLTDKYNDGCNYLSSDSSYVNAFWTVYLKLFIYLSNGGIPNVHGPGSAILALVLSLLQYFIAPCTFFTYSQCICYPQIFLSAANLLWCLKLQYIYKWSLFVLFPISA